MEESLRLERAEAIPDRDTVMKGLLFTYLILIPVMWSPFAFNIQWSDCLFLALLGLFFVQGRLNPSVIVLDYLVLAYVIGSCASLVNGGDVLKQGIECLKVAYLGIVYFVIGTLCSDQPIRIRLAQWTAWVAASVSLGGILYLILFVLLEVPTQPLAIRMLVPSFGEVLRLQWTLTTPELLGDYLTYGVPFTLALAGSYGNKRSQLWIAGAFIVIAMAEMFTFSHSWVGFVAAGLIVYRPMQARWVWILARRGLIIAMIALFIGMLSVSTLYVSDLVVEFQNVPAPSRSVPDHVSQKKEWPQIKIAATYSYLHYHLLKVLAWETFLEHPVTGVGLGNFNSFTEQGFDPHNTILGQLAETGLIGGVSLIGLWAWLFVAGRRLLLAVHDTSAEWIVRACLAGLVGLFINGLYTDIMHFRFLWVDLALLRGISLSFASRTSHGSSVL